MNFELSSDSGSEEWRYITLIAAISYKNFVRVFKENKLITIPLLLLLSLLLLLFLRRDRDNNANTDLTRFIILWKHFQTN